MAQKTFDQQVKRTSVWLAPTGIPLIAGAAGCAGRATLWAGCFFLSMLCAFLLSDQVDDKGVAKPGSLLERFNGWGDHCSKTLFNDWNYGWDSTVEFARSVKEFLGGNPVQENKQKYIDKSAPEASKPENTSQKKPIQNTTIKAQQEANLDDIAIKTDNVALSQVTAEQVAYNSEREKSGDQQP